MNPKCVALRRLIIAIFVVLAVIITVVALILFFRERDPTVTRVCPPGFTGEQCERSDFLGSLTWYADDFYTLDDGFQYRNGLAFRIYAPSAKSVTIHCVSFSGASSSYKMIKQDSGHWFYDVGGIGLGSEYYVTLTNSNEKQYRHLIQNGKEVVFTTNQWKNREPLKDYSAPVHTRGRSLQPSDVIYTLHIPSFSNGTTGMGTYQSASQLVSYLANLGVTVVRIMSLEPAICFSSLIDSRCWKRRSNVYEGVQHPAYGSQEDLIALVQAIHTKGMLAMIDVDWSGLSRYSDFYDYDGSSIPTSFGPLFQATYDTYEYQAKTCKKFDLSSGSAGETIVSSALSRLATVFGFDGIYWRGLMCLRLDSSNCERGTGSDNAVNTQYLREVVSRFSSSISFFVGEDNDNVYSLAGSAVQNIVDSVETDGFGFAAKRDLSIMNGLRSILLTETIVMQDLVDFLQSTSTLSTTNVISLETADTANEERLLNTCLTLEKGNYTFAYKRLLLAQFMIVSTPGILNFFQGSEYLEDDNFADLPSPLRIKEKVGDGGEQLTGVNAGFFKATKQMLQIRLQYELFNIVKPNIYFINNELSVFAYLRETTSESLVVIVNLSAKDYAEKQIMVDFPSNSALVKWTDLFTTDNPDYYPEFDDLRQLIRLFRCRDHFYDYCGMVSIGPFGVKIMHIAK